MKAFGIWFLCIAITFTPACGVLTDDQQIAVLAEIEAQAQEGLLTEAEAAFLREKVMSDGDWDWEAIGAVVGGLATAVLGSLLGVRLTRGPAKPLDKSQASVLAELLEDARKRKIRKDVAESSQPSVLDSAG